MTAGELNYVPGGIFNIYCRERGRKAGIEFVDLGFGYSHYFRVGAAAGQEFNLANITRRGTDSRFDISRECFDRWLARQSGADDALGFATSVTRQSRKAGVASSHEAASLIERIVGHRERGGKVACLFGHLTFDLAGLHDDGLVHSDMVDWLNHTLTSLAGSSTLVLVKPHVAEARYKQNRAPNQRFADLIKIPVSDNIVVLDPAWFNAHELFPHIDVGLVWRSTVAIELALAGIPAIIAGRECYFAKALDFHAPLRDREHYAALLRTLGDLPPTEGGAERAAMLLRYISHETLIELPYFRREKRGGQTVNAWNMATLADFRRRGDSRIDRICTEMLA
jgi:hypothetical protein